MKVSKTIHGILNSVHINAYLAIQCLSCNKNYSNQIGEKLEKRFKNTFQFSNNYINVFIFLLRKGVYRYGYMDEWEKFNETLPEKE